MDIKMKICIVVIAVASFGIGCLLAPDGKTTGTLTMTAYLGNGHPIGVTCHGEAVDFIVNTASGNNKTYVKFVCDNKDTLIADHDFVYTDDKTKYTVEVK